MKKTSLRTARRILTGILLGFLFAALPAAAQVIPHVTGTFLTPGAQTPSVAGLQQIATISGTPVYGTVDFQPYDSAGNRPAGVLCGTTTYVPQSVRAYIRGDGQLVNNAAAIGVDLIPQIGCAPIVVMRATIRLAPTPDGRVQSASWTEDKQLPQTASVDWGGLAAVARQTAKYVGIFRVQDEGVSLEQQGTLDFTGAGVTCTVDAPNARIVCDFSGGGGSSTTLKVNNTNMSSQSPLNFQDGSKISFTNPSAGNLQASIVAGSIADTDLAGSISMSKIASSTSAQLATLLSDETGSAGGGLSVFNQSPTIVTPTIASFTNAPHNHQNAAGGGALDVAAVTTGAFAKARQNATTVYTDQANTFGAFLQDVSAGTLKLPIAAGYSPTTGGLFGYDSTNNRLVFGNGSATGIPTFLTSTPTSGQCPQFSGTAGLVISVACSSGGNVSSSGTPSAGQAAEWVTASTIQGVATAGGGTQYLKATISSLAQNQVLCADATPKIVNCTPGVPGRSVTTTTDTIASSDRTSTITYNSGSAVAVTFTSPATLGNNFAVGQLNIGAGFVTSTLGAGTFQTTGGTAKALAQGEWCVFNSPNNTDVTDRCSSGLVTAASSIVLTRSATGVQIAEKGTTVLTDQANTFGAFVQTFLAGGDFVLADPTTPSKTAIFDLSNIASSTQRTVNIPNANSTTAQAISSTASQWITSMSAQGVFTKTQPAFSDISGSATSGQLPAAVVYNNQANTYTAGNKQTFAPNATNAGLNFGSQAGDPSTLADGDCWYNSTAAAFKCRENGTTKTMIGGGASVTIQTNSTNNASQTTLNFVNPANFNGLTFTFSNPTTGNETFIVGGTLANAGLANSATTVNGQTCTLGSSCTVNPPLDKSTNGLGNPTADATFTYPNTSTTGFSLSGTAPASVSTSTGTSASNVFTILGVTGGADSNATGTAGIGSTPSFTAGNGGAGTGTNTVGGAGGGFGFTTGNGGASAGTGANANGGNFTVNIGQPGTGGSGTAGGFGQFKVTGSALGSTSGTTGLAVGTIFNVAGIAGQATSNAAGTGGIGSLVSINSGVGGAGTGTNAVGGAGGTISFATGNGGASAGTGANANGGNFIFTVGQAGTGGTGTAGSFGQLQLTGTALSSTSGTTGANVGTVFNIAGITGQATSNAAGTGGIGSLASVNGGTGGAGTGTNAAGGAGGGVTLAGGNGGASAGTAANSNGGNVTLTPGTAGTGGSGAAGKGGVVASGDTTSAGFGYFTQGTLPSTANHNVPANSIIETAPAAVTAYTDVKPAAAATGIRFGVNASGVITENITGDSNHAIVQTAKTAAITTSTLCAATAGTACGQAGQYRVHWNMWGSGTACSSVTAGSVTFLLTWTDENAVTHSAVALQMMGQTGGATEATASTFPFQTSLANESASGDFTFSTNGTVIQYATGYTACTTGTGTYNLRASVEQLQ